MNVEFTTLLLVAIIILLVLVTVLVVRNGGATNGGTGDNVAPIVRWALEAIASAYNVAVDHLKESGELPDGTTRRRLAVAYYDTIPAAHRTFSVDEFADAVDTVFLSVDWAGTQLQDFLAR